MALGLPTDQRSQVMLLIIVICLTGGYFFYSKVHQPQQEKITAERIEMDSLQTILDKAKADLASGSIEDLRRKVDEYRSDLNLMRRLVPQQNDVPALIDDISTKAKLRGVTLSEVGAPQVEPGQPFDTHRYRMAVVGHYDQIGEFLSDVASLPRIVVPQDLLLRPATSVTQKYLSDTLGALLEAQFVIRTFVKSASPPGPKPGAKHAARGAPNAAN
jgi:type IV pilus assembly protein PilO